MVEKLRRRNADWVSPFMMNWIDFRHLIQVKISPRSLEIDWFEKIWPPCLPVMCVWKFELMTFFSFFFIIISTKVI